MEYLQRTVKSVQTLLDTSQQTNGPKGTIAARQSVDMINQELARPQSKIKKINRDLAVNPEALLTVKVENLHMQFPISNTQ